MFSEANLIKSIKSGLYLILLLPFLFVRSFMFPFITPKVFGFHIVMEIVFGLWLALIILCPQYRPRLRSPLLLALLVLLVLLTISSFLGIDFNRSFWSTQERALGLFSLYHFFALFLVLSSLFNPHQSAKISINPRSYLLFSFVVSVILSLATFAQWFYPDFLLGSAFGGDRLSGFFGNPTFFAAYLLFHVFIGLWLALGTTSINRIRAVLFGAAALFEMFVIVALTQTRGAILGLGAGLLALLLYFAFSARGGPALGGKPFPLSRKWPIALLTLLTLLAVAFWLTRTADFWQDIPGFNRLTLANITINDAGLQNRVYAWQIAWKSFLERPLLGWGFENFKYPFDKNFNPSLFRSGFTETYWDKPHNVFLEYLVTGGALSLLAYIGIFGAAFFNLLTSDVNKLAKPFILSALLAYILQNLVVFDTFGSYLMFFITLAFIESNYRQPSLPAGGRERSSASILQKAGIASGAALALYLIYLNVMIPYTNNRQYWGANYFVHKAPELALASYRSALTYFNPYVQNTRRDFGDVLTQMHVQGILPDPERNLPLAVSEVDKAIGAKPNDYFLYLSLADMITNFYSLNPPQLLAIAQSAINKAIELSPNRQQNYYVKTKLHLIKNEDAEAVKTMEKTVALDPEIGDPHFVYAFTLFEVGDSEAGFRELKRAKELDREPRTAQEARLLANYYGDAGRYTEAILLYKRALSLDPDDNEARLKLGIVYYYAGNFVSARNEISRVLQNVPDLGNSPNFELIRPILEDLNLL